MTLICERCGMPMPVELTARPEDRKTHITTEWCIAALRARVNLLSGAINELCPAMVGETEEQTMRRTIRELREERDKYASLYSENERLKNDLADIMEVKAGQGPTALASALAEVEQCRRENRLLRNVAATGRDLIAALQRAVEDVTEGREGR